MAVVSGIKEKVHLPIYDSFRVEPEEQFRKSESSSTIRFFVDVQGKTKLETNLQSASLLPHYNTFEARAMRVVISDLPPEFPSDVEVVIETVFFELDAEGEPTETEDETTLTTDLKRVMELLEEARASADGEAVIDGDDEQLDPQNADQKVYLTVAELEEAIDELEKDAPSPLQIKPNNGRGNFIGQFIYNTVTTFYVGEKIMIQMPSWFFPAGAGPYSESGKVTTHGEPSPSATFRFAEPIFIDKQQNFRVEIEVPSSDVLKDFQRTYGPLFIWVVLDGYMTRDVQ